MDDDDLRHEVCQIGRVSGLYLTDWVGAASVNEANILGVTHILSVLTAEELDTYGPDDSKDVTLRHLNIDDGPNTNLAAHFARECEWLDCTLRQKDAAVIVHCQQGISRSPAIVVAYLIWKLEMTFNEAIEEVKRSRSIVNINQGFAEQLRGWEASQTPNLKLNTLAKTDIDVSVQEAATPVGVITPVEVIDFVERER